MEMPAVRRLMRERKLTMPAHRQESGQVILARGEKRKYHKKSRRCKKIEEDDDEEEAVEEEEEEEEEEKGDDDDKPLKASTSRGECGVSVLCS